MKIHRPADWRPPPRPKLADIARSLGVIGTDLLPLGARLALHRFWPQPSTTTPDGLAAVRHRFRRTLDRLGVSLEVLHAGRVPAGGGLVFMWNQESHLDHLVLAAAIPRPFFSLYNNEVSRFPVYGAYLRACNHVHLDRTGEAQWRASIARAAERVHAGECALISPEGTRSWDGKLLPIKRGALLLAKQARRPVFCVTVIGGHARLPRGSAFVRPGPLRVVFSEPLDAGGDDEALRARLAETFEEERARYSLET